MYANEELRMSNAAPRVAVGRTTVATRGGGGGQGGGMPRGTLAPFRIYTKPVCLNYGTNYLMAKFDDN